MNINESSLAAKSCIPCQGGTPPLTPSEIHLLLTKLGHNWSLNDTHHLYKVYTFRDFMGPIAFVNKIAEISEKETHHPLLHITWGMCAVEIWTHKINGLTESDFILAAKIDSVL